MIARLQQLITLTLAGLAIVWALDFAALGHYALAASGVIVIGLSYALFIAFEFVLLMTMDQDDSALRPGIGQVLRAWAGEVFFTPLVFFWRQPFRSHREPNHLPRRTSPCRGVLFVHGFFCNRGLWNPWMHDLRTAGVPFLAITLEPPFGSIDAYVSTIEGGMARLEASTGAPPIVVAHSMGGLAFRAWLAGQPSMERVHRFISIASPHHGTWLARFAVSANGRQMRLDSRWLAALAERERLADRRRQICYYGRCDNIVFPVSSAILPGADNRELGATAHVQMAYHPTVRSEVMSMLLEPLG